MFLRTLVLVACCILGGSIRAQSGASSFSDTIDKYFSMGAYDKIISYGKNEIRQNPYDTLSSEYARLVMAISRSFAALESYADAAEYNLKAEKVYKHLNDSAGLERVYLNLSGIYYYADDSVNAYQAFAKHRDYSDPNAPPAARYMSDYMASLLAVQFGAVENRIATLDSLLYHLEGSRTIALNVWMNLLDLTDSLEFTKRLPRFLDYIADNDTWSDLNYFDAYQAAAVKAISFGRYDLFRDYTLPLDTLFHKLNSRLSYRRKAVYYDNLAKLAAFDADFSVAYLNKEQANYWYLKSDSIEGFEEIKRLEAMVEVRGQELRTEQLVQNLNSVKQQRRILLLTLLATLVVVFLGYILYRKARESSSANEDLALTRGQMISVLSHDLRSPLGQVKSILDLMDAEGMNADDLAVIVPALRKNTSLSLDLLEQTVNWINVNREDFKIRKEKVEAAHLVDHLENYFGNVARKKHIDLVFEVSNPNYQTDSFLIKTVLRNLLGNAVKFTPEGGEIKVSFLKVNNRAQITIKDNGLGMSEEDLRKVREGYSQSKFGSSHEGGAGLGLIIVQNALDRLDGELKVDSEVNVGSTFTIEFNESKTL